MPWGPGAQLLHIQTVAGLGHQARAMAGHLLRCRQVQAAVAGHEALYLRGGGISGADGSKYGLILRARHTSLPG